MIANGRHYYNRCVIIIVVNIIIVTPSSRRYRVLLMNRGQSWFTRRQRSPTEIVRRQNVCVKISTVQKKNLKPTSTQGPNSFHYKLRRSKFGHTPKKILNCTHDKCKHLKIMLIYYINSTNIGETLYYAISFYLFFIIDYLTTIYKFRTKLSFQFFF